MTRAASLLEAVQGLLERTYASRRIIPDIGRFVIGDRGYRAFYAAGEPHDEAGSGRGDGARTLVRRAPSGVRACIYYPDEQIRTLERFPPQRGIRHENVDAFATLVEELDHLLLIAERAASHRPVSLFELEFHANLSKHLVLSRFLAGRRPVLDEEKRTWLRARLFTAGEFSDPDPGVRQRYRDATRWALRLIDALPGVPRRRRLHVLRRFHSVDASGKVELTRRLAA